MTDAPATKPPSIGALRDRLTLQSPNRADDGGGGAVVTWDTVAELWAYVRPISGDERLRHDAVTARVTHEVWIRYRANVVPAMRFTDGARILDIVAVLDPASDPGRRDRLQCLCEERNL
jgi:SPP1 family predicted phage head-tail adaptor